jgi:hypothetical protein
LGLRPGAAAQPQLDVVLDEDVGIDQRCVDRLPGLGDDAGEEVLGLAARVEGPHAPNAEGVVVVDEPLAGTAALLALDDLGHSAIQRPHP